MNTQYGAYVESVRSKLQSDHFSILTNVIIGSHNCDLIGMKDTTFPKSRTYLCVLAFVENPDQETVDKHLSQVYEYARPYQRSSVFYIFPVLASPNFSGEVKDHVRIEKGFDYYNQYKWTVRHVVLAELQRGEVFHYDQAGLLDIPLKEAEKFTNKHFLFR